MIYITKEELKTLSNEEIFKKIKDGKYKFPLKKNFIKKKFDHRNKVKIIEENSNFFIPNLDLDLDKYDIFKYRITIPDRFYINDVESDIFQEEVRIQGKLDHKKYSLHEVWYKHPEYYKKDLFRLVGFLKKKNKDLDEYQMREMLYGLRLECNQFKPSLAYNIYRFYNAKKILDMSAGWGDRLLGAIANDSDLYVATDPNKKLFKGYKKMIDTKVPKEKRKNYVMINSGFETADISKYKGEFDMMLCSPPYFKFEIYDGKDKNQSVNKFKGLDNWLNLFLIPSLLKAFDHIKKGGIIALHLTDLKEDKYMYNIIYDLEENGYKLKGIINVYAEKKNIARPIWIFQS